MADVSLHGLTNLALPVNVRRRGETLREIAGWPEGEAFPTLPSMMRITLNAIVRAVFGAEGAELDELRRIIPPWVTPGSRLATLPKPARTYGRYSPWGRLVQSRRSYDAGVAS